MAILAIVPPLQIRPLLPGSSNTAQPLEHSLRLVGNGIDSRGLIADLVKASLHGLDELLLRLMRTILVAGVVYVDEDGLDILGFLGGAIRVDAGDTYEFEEVEEDGLGEALEVEGAVAVAVGGRSDGAIRGGLETLYARLFERRELVFQLER